MWKFLTRSLKKRGPKRKDGGEGGDKEQKEDDYIPADETLMIFGGSATYGSKRQQKVARREVYSATPAVPSFLKWSESPVTFNRDDHPDYVPYSGRYPLVVDPIIGTKRLTKVLMDGGSGLNILYVETLDAMKIPCARLRHSGAPFFGVVPRKQAEPIRQIDLPVTFGGPSVRLRWRTRGG